MWCEFPIFMIMNKKRTYTTLINAVDPKTGLLCHWVGPDIEADSLEDAVRYCQENGLGYCRVDGEKMGEVDFDVDGDVDEEAIKLMGFLADPSTWN